MQDPLHSAVLRYLLRNTLRHFPLYRNLHPGKCPTERRQHVYLDCFFMVHPHHLPFSFSFLFLLFHLCQVCVICPLYLRQVLNDMVPALIVPLDMLAGPPAGKSLSVQISISWISGCMLKNAPAPAVFHFPAVFPFFGRADTT